MGTAELSPPWVAEPPRSTPLPRPREGHGIRHILACLDGSPQSEVSMPYAVFLARTFGARLTLLYVMQPPVDRSGALTTDALAWEISVRSLVVRHADERRSLLEISQREGIDLVVLSAHGSTSNPARTFGSVATHLLSHSMVPLLVLQDLPESERRHVPEEGELAEESRLPPSMM
ncbi:MAG TPA: universal stress protein [Polyangiaceae bacterium]